MAAVATALPTLSALGQALNAHDFQESRALYNSLRDDDAQLDVGFGIHLIHGYFQIPEGTIMVGTNSKNPNMWWAEITDFNKLEGSPYHGHIFVLTNGGFRAYGFQDGPLPGLANVKQDFLMDFSLLRDGVRNNHSISKLITDQGTILLGARHFFHQELSSDPCQWLDVRAIQWTAPRPAEHAAMTSGNHKVFDAGKPLGPKLEIVEDLKAALIEAGVM
ncbi:hypothetical protein GGR58DRAFT_500423 [Xylaria digitata]|nr:hypothetical protein GGR58DRAFT_500423 [Xylaria digitata]